MLLARPRKTGWCDPSGIQRRTGIGFHGRGSDRGGLGDRPQAQDQHPDGHHQDDGYATKGRKDPGEPQAAFDAPSSNSGHLGHK